jgi:hypothetical protein
MKSRVTLPTLVVGAAMFCAAQASAATFTYGVVGPNDKVRPTSKPSMALKTAALSAARNEFESFQVAFRSTNGPTQEVAVSLQGPLAGPGGAVIPEQNVTLFLEAYYTVNTPSNTEGTWGPWPDPLIPDVDPYFGEKRTAFPFDVPDYETRAIWVDVLVPQDAAAGDYAGKLSIHIGQQQIGEVGIELHVGTFELPSTSTLASAFGMGWSAPCLAHTGQDSCDSTWNEDKANELRALYLRSALDHRFTISDSDFQPPFDASAAPYETWVMPLIDGTGPTRLPGAKLTAIRIEGGDAVVGKWIDYAKSKGFFDRLFYYPVDEPSEQSQWDALKTSAQALHAADPDARVIITSTILETDKVSVTSEVDVFVPVINYLENKPGSDTYAGDQTPQYADWLTGKPNRALWSYQSCMSHGCGDCGTSTSDTYFTGWPSRVIDSSAVQNRCFPWIAFRLGVTGELYFDTAGQLSTAWAPNGQCAFSGSGDGTIFYPGKTSMIGGTHDIPVESIRMKMIREGMEDYEYLMLASKKDAVQARAVAATLFPTAYSCAIAGGKVDTARLQLFKMLDNPVKDAGPADAQAGPDAFWDAAADQVADAVADSPEAAADAQVVHGSPLPPESGGCGCVVARSRGIASAAGWIALLGLLAASSRRRLRSESVH